MSIPLPYGTPFPKGNYSRRRAARLTTNDFSTGSSVTAIWGKLGWRPLQQRRADARLCLFYHIVYGLVTIPMPEYIQPNTRLSKYCHSRAFRQLHTSADYYKCSFYPLANAFPGWCAFPALTLLRKQLVS